MSQSLHLSTIFVYTYQVHSLQLQNMEIAKMILFYINPELLKSAPSMWL
jgi:hypothetical protein